MPFEVDWDVATDRVTEVLPSAASELTWLQHLLGHQRYRLPDFASLAALHDSAAALRSEEASLWQDGFDYLPEASILAERVGGLLGDEADTFLGGLERAAHADGVGLELTSETTDERTATIARLERLRREPALLQRYAALLSKIWELARDEWEANGRQHVERTSRAWVERLRRGADVVDLCPPTHILNKAHHRDLSRLLTERSRVVVTPLHFARQGGFVIDMASYVHVGAPASPVEVEETRRHDSDLIANRLKVLADGTRLALLRQLVARPATVMDLARSFRLAQPTVSNHVRLLREAGLLDSQRDGARVIYTAPRERLGRLLSDTESVLLGPEHA
jgi:ArsR family transcriptional regulator